MNMESTVARSGSIIVSELWYRNSNATDAPHASGPAITISQQTGSGAHDIAGRVADLLQHEELGGGAGWKVYDRQLVQKALEEHHLPLALADKMPEDKRSYINEVMDDFMGLRPPSWVLVPQVVETILHLANAGHVVLVGRGATVVTLKMPGVFHVHLVASPASRIARVQKLHSLGRKEAAEFIVKQDRGSRRYARAHFGVRVEDELLYDLIINTDRIPYADTAMLIANAARRCFENRGHV
jgi:cytidylate kinase